MNALLNDLLAKEVGQNGCELLTKAMGNISAKYKAAWAKRGPESMR